MQSPAVEREPQSFDRVVSSMCTEPHPAAREAAERFLATNPGDPATYETVAELERTVVADLARLAEHPAFAAGSDGDHATADRYGYVTSGGTEANIQAVRAARERHRRDGDTRDRDEAGNHRSGEPNVVVPASAHFSFQKAASVLDVELREVPTHPIDGDPEQAGRVDLDALRAAVDEETALVVAVAGSTAYGRVDPVPDVAAVAGTVDAAVHVDAAWGGFYLPFTDHDWSFADAPVDTITIDPHKLGQAAVPAGGLISREPATLDSLAVATPYLETHAQATLTGTRSGAGVASARAAFDALYPDGYRAAQERATELAAWLASELTQRGYTVRPRDLPVVAVDLPESLVAQLREAGWRLSPTAAGEARVVCMPHVTRESLTALLADLDRLR